MYCDLSSQYIKVRKLFKGGNYSRKYGMYYPYLNTFLTRLWKLFKRRNYLQGYLLLDFISTNSNLLSWAIFHNFQTIIIGKVLIWHTKLKNLEKCKFFSLASHFYINNKQLSQKWQKHHLFFWQTKRTGLKCPCVPLGIENTHTCMKRRQKWGWSSMQQ